LLALAIDDDGDHGSLLTVKSSSLDRLRYLDPPPRLTENSLDRKGRIELKGF
jgi:hypothetical protein